MRKGGSQKNKNDGEGEGGRVNLLFGGLLDLVVRL